MWQMKETTKSVTPANIGVILAGGTGTRVGGSIPKQYIELCGKEVIAYSIDAFHNSERTDAFFIVAHEVESQKRRLSEKYGCQCITGGQTRNESIYNALHYIKLVYASCQNILIHEAARPLITSEIIDTYIGLLNEYDAVITTQHISDSLGQVGHHITDRNDYYLIQAPEAFKFDLMVRNFKKDSPLTATVQQLPFNIKVKKYYEFIGNLKITYPIDIKTAELIIGDLPPQ